MDLKIKDKTALVLASSKGLGKAIARELASEGANVMLTSRSEENLKAARKDLQQTATGRIEYVVMDQTDGDSIVQAVAETRRKLGPIVVLVNNSGGPAAGKFEAFTDEDWQKAFELTLFSYIRTIRQILPDLKETHGRILNNTSTSIKEPIDGLTLSNVFRMGIAGLSKTLSQELAADGILVNTIGPGKFQTDRIKTIEAANAKRKQLTTAEIQKENLKTIPLGRYGEPEEFAKVAAFLVSGANTYLTGQNILVEGGLVKAL